LSEDIWNLVKHCIEVGIFGVLFSLAAMLSPFLVVIVTSRWLHEDPANTTRRRARTAVLVLSGIAAVGGAYSFWHNRNVQTALQETVTVQGQSIDILKRRLSLAEQERSKQYMGLRDDERASTARINALHYETDSVRNRVDNAEKEAQSANVRAIEIARAVGKTNTQTNAILTEAVKLAKQAAAKAGVYHLPAETRRALLTVLGRRKRGTVYVACYSGMESACSSLADVFTAANWKTAISWAQRFYTGAGLDAPIDPNPNAGLIVWYAAGEERLGADIASALIGSGFAVDSRLADFPKGPDITLGVRFLRQ